MKMSDFFAGQSKNMLVVVAISVLLSTLLHFFFKIIFKTAKKSHGLNQQGGPLEGNGGAAVAEESTAAEQRPSGKSRKRGAWKTKTEFSHPWLLKTLKGHPGRVLAADLAPNGKYLAAACDGIHGPAQTSVGASRSYGSRDSLYRSFAATLLPSLASSPALLIDKLKEALEPYLLSPERMWAMGYPMELEPNSTRAIVYIHPPPRKAVTVLDVNAPEFIPAQSNNDSGRGSWGSSPKSDSDEEGSDSMEHTCVRCDRPFRITREGEYVEEEACVHHWGRVDGGQRHGCCGGAAGTRGCSTGRFHVWNGTHAGMNGPLEGFVRARSSRGGVFALDAEMCYTTAGLELASIAVVGVDGRVVYRANVRPSSPLVDCNTRFSGIRPRDLARATKSLRDVQNDILGFVGADTVLVGHALDNDLRALKLLHDAVVDTCALYPHSRGLPLRRSLRALAAEHLGRRVQRHAHGHEPVEDARAAMDLVLHKVIQDTAKPTLSPFLIEPYDPLLNCA